MPDEKSSLFRILSENYDILLPASSGVVASLLVSENKQWKTVLARVGSGLFFSLTFTDGFIHYIGRDPEIYRVPVAGLFAMTGFEIVRWLSTLNPSGLIKLWREARGKNND